MKKQKFNLNRMGFSLIELSVVILVIGLLVVGITKGGLIISKARLGSAKSLTSSSPVALTSDLVTWYESSLNTSFAVTEANEGTAIASGWNNNSPYDGNNALASTSNDPKYRESVINSIPSVQFLAADTLTFDSLSMNQKYYTVFVVDRRDAATGTLVDLGGNLLNYSTDVLLGSASVGSGTVLAYDSDRLVPRISTFLSDSTSKRVFINGTVGATTATAALSVATNSGVIGGDSYAGHISEIIIYNRGLSASERNDIQDYLSKKYSIKVTTSS